MHAPSSAISPTRADLPIDRTTVYGFAILALLFLILTFNLAALLDGDTYWHIVTGRTILETWSFPTVDTYSHTFAGEPWIAKEWLSQVLLALAYEIGGWSGVLVLTALITAATVALLAAHMLRRIEASTALLVTLTAFLAILPSVLARPHIVFHLILVVWLVALVRAVERGRAPHPALVLLMVAWVNAHASFLFGLGLAGLIGLEALARAEPGERARLFRGWAWFGALCALAMVATPYGWQPLAIAVDVFEEKEAILYITEWKPLDLFGAHRQRLPFVLLACLGAVALLVRHPLRSVLRIGMVALCAWMATTHVRFAGLFVIVTIVALAGPLAAAYPRFAARAVPVHPARETARRIALAATALVVVVGSVATWLRPVVPPPRNHPEAAVEAAIAAGLTAGRVVNTYEFGGYLIFRGIPTFYDGRSDQLFIGGFMHAYEAAMKASDPAALRAILESAGVSWALLSPGARIDRALAEMPDWSLLYEDEIAKVYVFAGTPGEEP